MALQKLVLDVESLLALAAVVQASVAFGPSLSLSLFFPVSFPSKVEPAYFLCPGLGGSSFGILSDDLMDQSSEEGCKVYGLEPFT